MAVKGELVSIIIPTYNRAEYIERAINSALSQSYKNIEIIVIDDGSIDNTKEIIEKFKKKIKYIYQKNSGVSAARNRGIKEAKGAWIAFLDSDDVWLHDKITKQMDLINNNNLQICFTGAELIKQYKSKENSFRTEYIIYKDGFDLLLNHNLKPLIPCTLIHKSLLIANPFNEQLRVAEDTELFYNLAYSEPFAYIPETLVLLNDDPIDRLTNQNYLTVKIRNKAALTILFNAYLKYNINPKNITILRRQIAFYLSEKAIIECIEGNKLKSRYHAFEGILFGVNFKLKIRNIMVFSLNRIMMKYYKQKWKRSNPLKL